MLWKCAVLEVWSSFCSVFLVCRRAFVAWLVAINNYNSVIETGCMGG